MGCFRGVTVGQWMALMLWAGAPAIGCDLKPPRGLRPPGVSRALLCGLCCGPFIQSAQTTHYMGSFTAQVDVAFIRPCGELVRRRQTNTWWTGRGGGVLDSERENSASVVLTQAAASTLLTWPLQRKPAININQEFHFLKDLMGCLLKQCLA